MEATFSSETSVDFQRTTQRYNPEESTLRNHRRKNFESYMNGIPEINAGFMILFVSTIF
jgi:hypothetical protein